MKSRVMEQMTESPWQEMRFSNRAWSIENLMKPMNDACRCDKLMVLLVAWREREEKLLQARGLLESPFLFSFEKIFAKKI